VTLVRVEHDWRTRPPDSYHLAEVLGACSDGEQTFCGLPIVDLLKSDMSMVVITRAWRFTYRTGEDRRSECCPECWTRCPEGARQKVAVPQHEEPGSDE